MPRSAPSEDTEIGGKLGQRQVNRTENHRRVLTSLAAGVVLFLAWSPWGTGPVTAQKQTRLVDTIHRMPAAIDTTPASFKAAPEPVVKSRPAKLPPKDFAPPAGRPVFRLRVPAIGIDEITVEGVSPAQLDVGPGHYPTCRSGIDPALCTDWRSPWPGEDGRVVISGHRTTHGAVFWELDKLRPGNRIVTQTKWGTFTYEVAKTRIVPAASEDIVVRVNRAEVVLTTCHPKFSAAQRLIVFGVLKDSAPPPR